MDKNSFVSIAEKYFKRFPNYQFEINTFLNNIPSLIIVIPSFNEEEISITINSLFFDQQPHYFNVEIIVLINNSLDASLKIKDTNRSTLHFLKDFANKNNTSNLSLHSLYVADLKPKHAGVGWARKIGMDIALRRFMNSSNNGVIVGLDADAEVSPNYFNSIYAFFKKGDYNAASIHFEHPINGNHFSDFQYEYIIAYELHLRYYKNVLAYAGFPFAFHTVGSSFALTALAYARQGGMNRRKAGEDFYFINKLIKGENFGEILDAKVIPSPRISERVPFGTGRAILKAFKGEKDLNLTYDFRIFIILKNWIKLICSNEFEYANFPDEIRAYINENEWLETHQEIQNNISDHKNYLKRFFAKYDAFWVLKFVHFMRDNLRPNSSLVVNVDLLLKALNMFCLINKRDQLIDLRKLDMKKGAGAP